MFWKQASEASEAGMDSVEAALEEAEKPKATVDLWLRHLDTAEDSRRLEPPRYFADSLGQTPSSWRRFAGSAGWPLTGDLWLSKRSIAKPI